MQDDQVVDFAKKFWDPAVELGVLSHGIARVGTRAAKTDARIRFSMGNFAAPWK
jgi:hypothetical protein